VSYTIIIPARFASQRFPGKLLADLNGKPVIEHVYLKATTTRAIRIIIATDNARIATVAKNFGAEVCLTSSEHSSGTLRIAEVIKKKSIPKSEVIVGVQADEPFIASENIDKVAVKRIACSDCDVVTLCEKIDSFEDYENPNVVKVVVNHGDHAMYFSRAKIPYLRDGHTLPKDSVFRHIGLYAYYADFIELYLSWPAPALEKIEQLEQLRILWNGGVIRVELATISTLPGIDTPEDLQRAIKSTNQQINYCDEQY